MKKIFVIILIGGLTLCCHNKSVKTKNKTNSKNIAQEEEIEELFSEYKYRFHQLMSGKYFRSHVTPKNSWIIEVDQLDTKSKGKLYKSKNVSFSELKKLALAYGQSKGFETEFTKSTKNKIKKLLSPNETEKKKLSQIFDKFSIDLSPKNIDSEIQKVITRYNLIDRLSKNHYSLRDTLRPLFWEICPMYFKLKKIKDSINKPHLDSIIKSLLTIKINHNTEFLRELINKQNDTTKLTIEKAISPIFNLKTDSVGIYNSYRSPADRKLLQTTTYSDDIAGEMILTSKTILYDNLLNKNMINKLFLYSTSTKYKSTVQEFGKYSDECLEYYYYNCKTDSLMKTEKEYIFASKYNLELEYYNDEEIDSIINLKYIDICFDCPSSWDNQKTYSKLKGYDNLYFTYVINNTESDKQTYTPMRALHYVNKDIVIQLWSSEIDLFGCSCL